MSRESVVMPRRPEAAAKSNPWFGLTWPPRAPRYPKRNSFNQRDPNACVWPSARFSLLVVTVLPKPGSLGLTVYNSTFEIREIVFRMRSGAARLAVVGSAAGLEAPAPLYSPGDEHEAARWVLAHGGSLAVKRIDSGEGIDVRSGEALPAVPFRVVTVILQGNRAVTSADTLNSTPASQCHASASIRIIKHTHIIICE